MYVPFLIFSERLSILLKNDRSLGQFQIEHTMNFFMNL